MQPEALLILFPTLSLSFGDVARTEFNLRKPISCFPNPDLFDDSLTPSQESFGVGGAEFKDTTEEEPDASGARTVNVRFSDVILVASRVNTWKETIYYCGSDKWRICITIIEEVLLLIKIAAGISPTVSFQKK